MIVEIIVALAVTNHIAPDALPYAIVAVRMVVLAAAVYHNAMIAAKMFATIRNVAAVVKIAVVCLGAAIVFAMEIFVQIVIRIAAMKVAAMSKKSFRN